jgi:hypothetical protein
MFRSLKLAAALVVAMGASSAFADIWAPYTEGGWYEHEWRYPPSQRPGFENLNGCPPQTHGVPFPNGNGYRCVQNGW